jgi:hypothetical protein
MSRTDLPPVSRLRGWLLQALAGLIGPCIFLVVLIGVGKLALERLRGLDRYTAPFVDIDCGAPPSQDRREFLAEVQYLGGLPDRLRLLDPDVAERLADAFGRHPWVEKVERVEIAPPREVRVRLAYRKPVLAVVVPTKEAKRLGGLAWIDGQSGAGTDGTVLGRTVDARGRLLPLAATFPGIPVLRGEVAPPQGPAGTAWGDPVVAGAARIAAAIQPWQERFQLGRIEATADGFVWSNPGRVRVVWGHPPGDELSDEASAPEKVAALLEYAKHHGDLASPKPQEHDVRPKDRPVHHDLSEP